MIDDLSRQLQYINTYILALIVFLIPGRRYTTGIRMLNLCSGKDKQDRTVDPQSDSQTRVVNQSKENLKNKKNNKKNL